MLFKSFFALLTIAIASNAAATDNGEVLTVKKIYHTIIDKSPFLVDRTTTVVWTATADTAVETPV
ncbi:hypothetical protein Hypma_008492 [Hypsizygus marmoreus]|uniref:Uncharacterized protein n=1 Tax=Hypsizygus marmoreus TaxID=39966 RepID=A0A369JT50_HYPMA|nr:hypothetical protein Hypma_008492 [Hypsizygus marmoreus]